ncbi:MAG: excinuclease ABC subunit UvrA [Bacteroidales bacterium]|nr:excinuclease ABC subunit UvrA [Bacteroidales bacterium]
MEEKIVIRNATVNNLKHVTVEIPRDKIVVVTGVSGSGKSSLAFDTLFAEGQRRFAQSLSSYARQFLGRMSKPDVESIEGVPPAIAIEQKVSVKNPRSTVATTTEIYDFIRLIFARIGKTYSPVSGGLVHADSVADVLKYLDTIEGTVLILAPVNWGEDWVSALLGLKEDGFSRLLVEGKPVKIDDVLQSGEKPEGAKLLVDRFMDRSDRARLISSVGDAFKAGGGEMSVAVEAGEKVFSDRFELDGIKFRRPDEFLFSFNSPLGACPVCGGLGKIIGISEDLVIPDKTKSIYDGAIACWRGDKMVWFKDHMVALSGKYGIDIFTPYLKLDERTKRLIWEGDPPKPGDSYDTDPERLIGINEFFAWVETQRYKIQYKYMLSRFSGKTVCHSCHGSRLRPEALYVKVAGRTIHDYLSMTVEESIDAFKNIELSPEDRAVVEEPLFEVLNRLQCLEDVGLGYLTLSRSMNTLSGGESQRVNLVTALGSSLVGSMYILDEPSIGLHPRDTERLIGVLKRLRDLGNTVIVVEHDEEIIRAADVLIDMGPLAGTRGGEIVFEGKYTDKLPEEAYARSLTLQYLSGRKSRYMREKRGWNYSITVQGAMEHNLKTIDVQIPLGVLTVVSGVSGSGKSTLVGDILYPALYRQINEAGDPPGAFKGLAGNLDRITRVEYVDQNPIGKSTRSNPVTYLKVYDLIRKLLSDQQYAKVSGFGPSFFSFNQEGGRCPECQGEGVVTIEMQFMSDVTMVCESCGGKRFKPEILEVRYRGKNVDDILNMSVSEAIEFFSEGPEPEAKEIALKLQPLVDVGLEYLKLAQSSSTLSGGESQRIKLAYFLAMSRERSGREKIMFIFDEPTTGLHFSDVERLLKAFDALLERGHSVLVVEHNTDVIKAADWVIDLGPDAGERGGEVVFAGTPEDLAKTDTFTAQYIK